MPCAIVDEGRTRTLVHCAILDSIMNWWTCSALSAFHDRDCEVLVVDVWPGHDSYF